MDLDSHKLQAFTKAYAELESSLSGLNILIETYFADVPAEAYKTLTSLKGITAYGFDLVHGTQTLDLIKGGFPKWLMEGISGPTILLLPLPLYRNLRALWAKVFIET